MLLLLWECEQYGVLLTLLVYQQCLSVDDSVGVSAILSDDTAGV